MVGQFYALLAGFIQAPIKNVSKTTNEHIAAVQNYVDGIAKPLTSVVWSNIKKVMDILSTKSSISYNDFKDIMPEFSEFKRRMNEMVEANVLVKVTTTDSKEGTVYESRFKNNNNNNNTREE